MTPVEKSLFRAVKNGDTGAVSSLLAEHPALIHARDAEQSTPLHWAAWKNQVEVAKVLLSAGADVNAVNQNDHWGTTPLHAAAHGNQKAVAEVLIDAGADLTVINQAGRTPLMETTIHHATAAEKLIRARGGK
jgi:ankyrin repeat protein